MRQYKAKSGAMLWKPSASWLTAVINDDSGAGFCLACGESEHDAVVEPDAGRYKCEACGEHKVYGAEELLLRGLFYYDEVTT